MERAISLWARTAIALTLFVGLIGAGFAHDVARTAPSPALAAFVAAGGTLDDLCGGSGHGESGQGGGCDACRLVGAAVLPPVGGACVAVVSRVDTALVVVAERIRRTRPLDPARLSRAPPLRA